MASATAFDASSTHSQSAKSTNSKRRWRDMGFTGAANSSFTNLMRSAARRSTDSLRSAASNASRSRVGKGKKQDGGASSRPPSAHSSVHKDLPGLPPQGTTSTTEEEADRRRSSSVSSGVIHDVPEDAALEFYEMPEDEDGTVNTSEQATTTSKAVNGAHNEADRDAAKTPTNENTHDSKRDTVTINSLRSGEKLDRHGSIVAASGPVEVTTRSTSLTNIGSALPSANGTAQQSYDGWTAMQDEARDEGAKTPTNNESTSHHQMPPPPPLQQQQQQRFSSSAKSLARKSLTAMRGSSKGGGGGGGEEGRASIGNAARNAFSSITGNSAEPPLPTNKVSAHDNVGTQWASDKVGGGDGNTIAQLYAVFGLPKDPTVWTLAEEDCVTGVHHLDGAISRFWRPEVLGCSICPSPSDTLGNAKGSVKLGGETGGADVEVQSSGASKWEGRTSDGEGKKSQSPKFIEMSDGRGGTEKTETARVLSKALKLSFTREVEIVAEQGHYPPKASSHTFSFSVPTVASTSDGYERTGGTDGRKAAMATGVSVGMAQAASGVGEGYGLTSQRRNAAGLSSDGQDGPRLATFYGVALTVWSAADEKRAKVIRKELSRAAKQRGGGLSTSKSGLSTKTGLSESGVGGDANNDDQGLSAIASSPESVFFMPYAICIVSRFPLYNLLGDWNKMAWHKYSRNIEMHNQLMSTILRHPAPRLGEEVSVGSPDKDVSFHTTFPGAVEWGTGLIGIDFAMWPLFSALSAENVLSICEIALGYNGRVLFISRHPALLGMAVESVRYLVEQCGWRGIAHQNCHARDVRIYLEDPGTWIIGINTELRGLVQPAKEVCVVDLDLNRIECANPPPNALSKGPQREKRRKRIMQAVFVSNFECSPPREFVDAYPGGRLRPLSRMVTRDLNSAYEQLPQPRWWNQTSTIQAFDAALREGQKQSFFKKVFNGRRASRSAVASPAEISAILALRKRASTFVDARDGLENKIGRLNKRLAFLMSESEMWRAQFSKIQILVDRLTKEANDLRAKVDKERRESKRLSSRLAERDIEQVNLQLQLKETESAREEAIQELVRMKTAMESVEQEREVMMDEIRAVLAGGGNIEDVNLSVSRLDLPSFNPLSRSSSPTGSQASMTPSQAAEYILKARAIAEARISEGRPGRTRSRTTSRVASSQGHQMLRSLSQDRGERNRKGSFSGSTNQNHFPDEQMNFEIQQRTSMVTDQISRIQQQLESTLTNLEGRRSGTYERESDRRRMRRSSNASINSNARYEYRGSSVGHGAGGADSVGGFASEDGHGTAGGGDDHNYEMVESVNDPQPRGSARRRRERNNGAPPTASSQSLRDAYAAGSTASHTSSIAGLSQSASPPVVGPKSLARRSPRNEWRMLPVSPTNSTLKAVATDAGGGATDVPASSTSTSTLIASTATATPATGDTSEAPLSPSGEVTSAQTNDDTSISNGVASQPLLSALQSPLAHSFDVQRTTTTTTTTNNNISKDDSTRSSSIDVPSKTNNEVNGGGEWQAEHSHNGTTATAAAAASATPAAATGASNGSARTSPTLANVSGPENEIMISSAGWILENGKGGNVAKEVPTSNSVVEADTKTDAENASST